MKKTAKNEVDMMGIIGTIQSRLIALDKKMDALLERSLPKAQPSPKPLDDSVRLQSRPDDRNKGRVMHEAICADCKKGCSIPFKPSGDRPVYCKDCFSRRKMINLSKIGMDDQPKEAVPVLTPDYKPVDVPKAPVIKKKKVVPAKKTVTKKKTVPKKK